jgi:alkanesulfonate monooxygenase SsuD/methylene tetrahydromethanopterin reductase-like flavin-dependent oxidoreductase (luciferase family)
MGGGGHPPAALRRTARHGDGWHPVGAIAASPLPPEEMRTHLDTLRRLTEAEGRDFSELTISYKAPLYDTGVSDRHGSRRSFSGTAEEISEDIRTFAKLGVHELIFDFRGDAIADSIARLQKFAAEVVPLVGD